MEDPKILHAVYILHGLFTQCTLCYTSCVPCTPCMPNCATNGRGACRPICSERWLRTLKYCLLCLANPVCSTILARPLIFEGGGCPNHCLACPAHPVRPSVCPSTKIGPLHSNKLPSETFAPWYFLYWFCFHNKYICNTHFHIDLPTTDVDLFFHWRIIFVCMCHFALQTEG